MYRIIETCQRGKIAVASKDLMPGELVLQDINPLLYISPKLVERCKRALPPGMAIQYAGFLVFLYDVPPEKKKELLEMSGPITGNAADEARTFARKMGKGRLQSDLCRHPLNDEEIERFVRVASIVRMNVFGDDRMGYSVFGDFAWFAHSCGSNCAYQIDARTSICYAKTFIKAGEQLTISYFPDGDLNATHERRYTCLLEKDFTCHCPRCDAPGDDTRQFDCFDPACKGVMMVCQPINQNDISQTGRSYTGVEYVEPHLLPCTECHRPAYSRYQISLLAIEKQLKTAHEAHKKEFEVLLYKGRYSERYCELEDFMNRLLAIKYPKRHSALLSHLHLILRVIHALYLLVGTHVRMVLQTTATRYLDLHEVIFKHVPLSALSTVVSLCCSPLRLVSVFPAPQDLQLCRRALRMQLIQDGREFRRADLDSAVEGALRRSSSELDNFLGSLDLCAFCEESPLRAASTLKVCTRCQKVSHCSEGCQKAHLKLHKEVCWAVSKWNYKCCRAVVSTCFFSRIGICNVP